MVKVMVSTVVTVSNTVEQARRWNSPHFTITAQ